MRLPFVLLPSICIILLSCTPAKSQVGEVISVGRLVYDILTSDTLTGNLPLEDRVKNIATQISTLETKILKIKPAEIIAEIQRFITRDQRMNAFFDFGDKIDNWYNDFQLYANNSNFETNTLRDFAEACVSHASDELPSVLNSIYGLVKPTQARTNGIYNLLIEGRQSQADAAAVCGTVSLQEQVYRLHALTALYMVKGYAMKLHAYGIKKTFDGRPYTAEISRVKTESDRFINELEDIAWRVMNQASRDIRTCDPAHHEEGRTYLQLQWLFGAVIIQRQNLDRRRSCSDMSVVSTWGTRDNEIARCNGKLYDCWATLDEQYCPPTKSYRRYDGLTGRRFAFHIRDDFPRKGDTSCANPIKFPFDTGYEQCACWCDDVNNPNTIRTFSTREIISDEHNDRVITGLRFIERRRVIHIQIQQGKLGPNGIIDKSTVEWKPIQEFDYTSSSTRLDDYWTLEKWNNRMYLDTVIAPKGEVLTGIKFEPMHGDGVSLRIRTSKFSYTTGELFTSDHYGANPATHRNPLILSAPHIPTLADDKNVVNTNSNMYVEFRQTDWVKDAGQQTIPFLDSQEVVTDPPALISGAGLYHKGQSGYGGFLGLKLVTYDYTEMVRHR